MTAPAKRRPLEFSNLDEVIADVRQLRDNGYDSTGAWNLAQACGHVGDWMRFPMDGFPKPPFPIGVMLWVMRHTVAQGQLKKMLAAKSMPAGNPTMKSTVHSAGEDESHAVDDFCAIVERFKESTGPYHPSPLFGDLDRPTLLQLQLVHSALHLSFLIPHESAEPKN